MLNNSIEQVLTASVPSVVWLNNGNFQPTGDIVLLLSTIPPIILACASLAPLVHESTSLIDTLMSWIEKLRKNPRQLRKPRLPRKK